MVVCLPPSLGAQGGSTLGAQGGREQGKEGQGGRRGEARREETATAKGDGTAARRLRALNLSSLPEVITTLRSPSPGFPRCLAAAPSTPVRLAEDKTPPSIVATLSSDIVASLFFVAADRPVGTAFWTYRQWLELPPSPLIFLLILLSHFVRQDHVAEHP